MDNLNVIIACPWVEVETQKGLPPTRFPVCDLILEEAKLWQGHFESRVDVTALAKNVWPNPLPLVNAGLHRYSGLSDDAAAALLAHPDVLVLSCEFSANPKAGLPGPKEVPAEKWLEDFKVFAVDKLGFSGGKFDAYMDDGIKGRQAEALTAAFDAAIKEENKTPFVKLLGRTIPAYTTRIGERIYDALAPVGRWVRARLRGSA